MIFEEDAKERKKESNRKGSEEQKEKGQRGNRREQKEGRVYWERVCKRERNAVIKERKKMAWGSFNEGLGKRKVREHACMLYEKERKGIERTKRGREVKRKKEKLESKKRKRR